MNDFTRISRTARRAALELLTTLGLVGASATAYTAHAADRICFPGVPGVTACIEGRFAEFWQSNGGLAVFGYPLGAAAEQRSHETGATYLTQYFERQRFELHADQARPYDVLLGRLGDDGLRQQGRDWRAAPQASPATPHFFAATGHAIGQEFWGYWRDHGLELRDRGTTERESLALLGLPLTEPAFETNASGDRVLTQYFERARLELAPRGRHRATGPARRRDPAARRPRRQSVGDSHR